ncbi:MAG: hypothetical protein ABI680_09975 [Chthoniobacteraceae bacterium]
MMQTILPTILALLTVAASAEGDAPYVFLDNGKIKLGVRKDRGASISYLSLAGSDRNVLNNHDTGRCVQQSYYGKADGSLWGDKPWRWNPVQGGHYRGEPAKIQALETDSGTLYSRTTPKHWATGADIPEMVMEQWITLDDRMARVRFKMTYHGTETHPEQSQEVPAFFVDAGLNHLVFYQGIHPGQNELLTRVVPGWPNERQSFDEHWAAYVDDHDWGIGLLNAPVTEATTYRYTPPGAPPEAQCSYFAPVARFSIKPGLTYEYEVALMVGTVAEIRAAAVKFHREKSKSANHETP